MPTHSPEPESAYYEGDTREVGYATTGSVTVVSYHETEDDGYAFDPDAHGEPSRTETEVLTAPVEEIYWDTDEGKRAVAAAILRHHLEGVEPTDDDLDSFMLEFGETFKDGLPWTLDAGAIADVGFSGKR